MIHPKLWEDSCTHTETTLHQLSPYIGKMKSTIAKTLIGAYTRRGDTILDPFSGSGTVPLEAVINGRHIVASDINPYAILLTRAKLNPYKNVDEAIAAVTIYLNKIQRDANDIDLNNVPLWIRNFFHHKTLKETLMLTKLLIKNDEYFLLACLMGILHHQRPGFLSYPASHLVPYLRTNKFPRKKYPSLYDYRAVEDRLKKKIIRTYKRFVRIDDEIKRKCLSEDATKIDLHTHSIDAVITSPPYMNALNYARDNRLRLWFLNAHEFKKYDDKINNTQKFLSLMEILLNKCRNVVRPKGKCIFVIGEVKRNNTDRMNVAELLLDIAVQKVGGFKFIDIIHDEIPDKRRSRRNGRSTKNEWVLVLQNQ